MPITKQDIKLLQAERMTEDTDGGGYMTSRVIQDGVENNLFPDVSSIDRARGAIDARKFYAAVLTDSTDVYLGSHLIFDDVPADPAVNCLLIAATNAAEVRSELMARLNSSAVCYGTLPLREAGAVGDRSVKADGVDAQLIPVSDIGTTQSGPITVTETDGSTLNNGLAYVAAGAPRAAFVSTSISDATGTMKLRTLAMPGTLSGSIDIGQGAVPLSETYIGGAHRYTYAGAAQSPPVNGYPGQTLNFGSPRFTGGSATYTPVLRIALPVEWFEIDFNAGMSASLVRTLPHTTQPRSEVIWWTAEDGLQHALVNFGPTVFGTGTNNTGSATIDRTTGEIAMTLSPAPKVGTKIQIGYVRSGYARALGAGALGGGGTFANSAVPVTASSGWRFRAATFRIGTEFFDVLDTEIRKRFSEFLVEPSSVVGSFDKAAGKLLMPGYNGQTIADWYAVEDSVAFPSSFVGGANIGANINPSTLTVSGTTVGGTAFTATANAAGEFATALVTGTYDRRTGNLNLTFTQPVAANGMTWTGTQSVYAPAPLLVTDLDPAAFPTSGRLPVLAPGRVVVVHHTATTAPQTVGNGADVNLGRTRVADARVFGANGAEIMTGFTLNKATGHVVFGDVSGYSQPVTIRHRIEDMALANSVDPTGKIEISRPLSHAFPIGSFVSSALVTGDLQARVRRGFAQTAWTGAWSDTRIGDTPLADFNAAAFPIVVTNRGALKERWAVIFTGSTSFRLIGEQVGQIVTNGSTGANLSPINPATNTPYFTIPKEGWGMGWAAGNVYRFDTDGANVGAWVLRSISPSDPYPAQVRVTVAVRGDIDNP